MYKLQSPLREMCFVNVSCTKMMHFCTQCVDAIEKLSEDVFLLQEVHRNLR